MLEIVFGAAFGFMVAFLGLTMMQSITIGVSMSNPIPIANLIFPTIGGDLTITGVGWLIFVSLMLLLVIIIGAVFLIGLFLPGREQILKSLMLFAIFFFLIFLAVFWVGFLIVSSPFWGLALWGLSHIVGTGVGLLIIR